MRHDWSKVKAEWLTGKHRTLDDLAKARGIRPSYLRARAAKEKWSAARTEVEQAIVKEVAERTVASEAARLAEAKERHLRLGKLLQAKGYERLKDARMRSESNAVIALRTGVAMEREALGLLDKEANDVSVHITQQTLVANGGVESLRAEVLRRLGRIAPQG